MNPISKLALFILVIVSCTTLVSCAIGIKERPDDVLQLAHGLAYRADLGDDGWTKFPPVIKQESVELRPRSNVITIKYRKDIEVEQGQRANIIFYIQTLIDQQPMTVEIKPLGLPEGMTNRVIERWRESDRGFSQGALQIQVSRKMVVNMYQFEFRINVNGEDCGTLPCTIKVIE
jgi:hypothetical protein